MLPIVLGFLLSLSNVKSSESQKRQIRCRRTATSNVWL